MIFRYLLQHSKATETTESNVQDTTKVENETKEDLETNKDVPMICILGKDVNLADLRIPDSMKGRQCRKIQYAVEASASSNPRGPKGKGHPRSPPGKICQLSIFGMGFKKLKPEESI